MGFVAVEELDDALERTKDILLPFDLKTWSKLAFICLFLGGTGFSFFNVPSGYTGDGQYSMQAGESMAGMATALPLESAVAAGAVGAVFLLVLGFMYLSSVFEFVMYRAVREKKVSIRDRMSEHAVDGLKYFGFQLVYALAALAMVAAGVGSFVLNPLLGVLAFLVLIPVFIVVAVFAGVVHDFALQMMVDGKGFRESVMKSVGLMKSDWEEFGAYLLLRLVVSWTVSIGAAVIFMIPALVIGLPFLFIVILLAEASPILAGITGVAGLIVVLVFGLYVSVPFKTYMYSYFVELYDGFMDRLEVGDAGLP
ncbi:MAG: hypothetical protein ABEJ95_05650 [Candidatus Nanohalobium sp.]